MMNDHSSPPSRLFTPILSFIATAIIAFVLLVVALVVWLAEMLHSASIAALIIGGGFLALALIIYLTRARKAIDYLHNRLETVYDVAYAARRGYMATIKVFNSFFSDFFRS